MGEKSFIILDIDNCISDDGWRIKHIDWTKGGQDRFHKYHSLSAWDEPGNRHLWEGVEERIALLTARPVIYADQTKEWLRRAGVNFEYLLMRGMKDLSHPVDLKRRQVDALLYYAKIEFKDIACAYDDRQDIVDMYNSMVIPSEVAKLHDIDAMRTQP